MYVSDYFSRYVYLYIYIYIRMFQIISILEMSVDQATSILMILMLIIGSFLFMGIGAIQVGENDDVYLHKLFIRIMSLFLDVHVWAFK